MPALSTTVLGKRSMQTRKYFNNDERRQGRAKLARARRLANGATPGRTKELASKVRKERWEKIKPILEDGGSITKAYKETGVATSVIRRLIDDHGYHYTTKRSFEIQASEAGRRKALEEDAAMRKRTRRLIEDIDRRRAARLAAEPSHFIRPYPLWK